jgi:hypothetical protein
LYEEPKLRIELFGILWKNHPSLPISLPQEKGKKETKRKILVFGETIVQVGL